VQTAEEALGGVDHAMLLLDTSFLIEFEDELAHQKIGPAQSGAGDGPGQCNDYDP
jgi:hypothetical protein